MAKEKKELVIERQKVEEYANDLIEVLNILTSQLKKKHSKECSEARIALIRVIKIFASKISTEHELVKRLYQKCIDSILEV